MYKSRNQVSELIGCDPTTVDRLVQRCGLSYTRTFGGGNGQKINGLTEDQIEILKKEYCQDKDIDTNIDKCESKQGVFYVISLIPSLDSCRLKLGWTSNIDSRLDNYRTICPNAEIKKFWLCKSIYEKAIMDMATSKGAKRIGYEVSEVYQVDSVDFIVDRIDQIFSFFE